MKRRIKAFLIASAVVITLLFSAAFMMYLGVLNYTSRCAHITDKQAVYCEVGDTLTIDDLADFSNYDERKITGIADGEGVISEDGMSITITKAEGFATVYVYAHNSSAPERTEHAVKVMIMGD